MTHHLEYPDLGTRYLMPPERPTPGADAYTVEATRLVASEDGVMINGQPVPWYLARVPIQVDARDDSTHTVVYLPVLVNGPVEAGPGVRDARLGELLAEDSPDADDQGPGDR